MAPRVGMCIPCLLGIVLATGCTTEGPLDDITEDQRIDGADVGNDPESFGSRMCVAPDGTIYVIWMDNRANPTSDRNDIYMNRSPASALGDGGWLEQPKRVNAGDPDSASRVFNPDIFCNDDGAFVVWEDDRDGQLENHQIYFNFTTDLGETFQPADLLIEDDADGNTMSLEPQIVGNGSTLYAVWYDSKNGAYDIFMTSASLANPGQWKAPVRVDSDAPAGDAYSARPVIEVATENDSNLWIAWEDSRDGAADIYFARSETGGTTWSTDVRLDTMDEEGANDSFEPQICTDGAQTVYVVWHDAFNSETNRDIYLNFSGNAGANWLGTAQRIDGQKRRSPEDEEVFEDAPGFGNSLFPKCVVDDLTAHLVWYDQVNEGEGYDIYYRSVTGGLPDGDAARRLDLGDDADEPAPAGAANSTAPLIAQDGQSIVVLWQDGRFDSSLDPSGYVDLFYSYRDETTNGDFVARDFRVDSWFDASSYKVDVDMDLLGKRLFATWVDGRNGTGDVFFTFRQLGEASRPPSLADLQQQ